MARFKMSPNQSHSQCPKKSVEVGNKSKMAPALHLARTAITPHQVDCTTQGCVISNPWVQFVLEEVLDSCCVVVRVSSDAHVHDSDFRRQLVRS